MKTNKPVPMRTATWYRTSLALGLTTLALVSLLQGCGGNSGVTTLGGDTTLSGDEIERNGILANTPKGETFFNLLYSKTRIDSNYEFLALIQPVTGIGSDVEFYGWNYGVNANDPWVATLYHGQLKRLNDGNASNVANSWKVNEGRVLEATAGITGGSTSSFIANISIANGNSTSTSRVVTAYGLAEEGYTIATPAPSLSQSSWTGKWNSSISTLTGKLRFGLNPSTDLDASVTNWDCIHSGTLPLWTWTQIKPTLFKVGVVMGNDLNCSEWQGKQLTGFAVLSHLAGVDRLDMMLLDGTGAGISYRGTYDRAP